MQQLVVAALVRQMPHYVEAFAAVTPCKRDSAFKKTRRGTRGGRSTREKKAYSQWSQSASTGSEHFRVAGDEFTNLLEEVEGNASSANGCGRKRTLTTVGDRLFRRMAQCVSVESRWQLDCGYTSQEEIDVGEWKEITGLGSTCFDASAMDAIRIHTTGRALLTEVPLSFYGAS